MPQFKPLAKPATLPAIGSAIERAVMDWKAKPTTASFERAKDVCAFANHLGGTILIGAAEKDGQLAAYVPMPPNIAGKVRDDYSKAIAERCDGLPRLDFEEYDVAGGSVIAVNVWPSLNLVGFKARVDKASEGWGDFAYLYPVRTGTDTIFLKPSQLAMYMTPEIRRVSVLLAKIPRGTMVQFIESLHGRGKSTPTYEFDEVAEEENLVKFFIPNDGRKPWHVPLDRILTAYESTQGGWTIVAEYYR